MAHGDFRSLPHLRLTTFPVKGFPRLDNGKKHIDFLKIIYLRCQPWKTETLLYLDHGLDVAHLMVEKFQIAKELITDKQLAEKVGNSVDLTYWLIKTNNLYVKTFFSYFDYREFSAQENKELLVNYAFELRDSIQKFRAIPGCVYRLDGMEQLLKNVDQLLLDFEKEEQKLANAPDDEGIKKIIAGQQEKYADVLKKFKKKAIKFLHWEGRVDGMDLIHIKTNKLEVEHLRYDNIAEMDFQFLKPLPEKNVTVVIKDIQARSFRPFILEQPNKENDYTVTIYLSDYPKHGYSWWKFDLYYIPKPPDELDIAVPWN